MNKLSAKILASVLTASMVLAGCSNAASSSTAAASSTAPAASSTTASSTAPAASSEAAASDAPQEITVAISSQIANLDTGLNSTTHIAQILEQVSGGLFYSDAHGALQNDLCEDYTISPDGLTYTFKIKQGIEWSDGKPLTAHDWVYGIKRTIGYGPDNTFMSADMCRFIKGAQDAHDNALDVADMTDVGVVALDDYTLEITLEMVCPYFIKIVGGNAFAPQRADFAVEHESTWSLKGGYPSIGPFMVSEVSENESVTLVKNPNYHDAENVKLDQITYLVMPDENAQLAAFKSGQIDVAYAVPSAIASSAEYADFFYRPEAYMSSYFVALNSGTKGPEALKDVRVRKALAMAIDKNVMLTILDAGDYIVPLDGWVPYGFEGLEGDFRAEAGEYFTYNAEEAKKLLAEAGYNESNPLKLEYLYSSNQFHGDVAQMLQQFWSAIGVQVELKAVEMGVFYDYVDYGDFQMSRYALNSTVDPLSYLKIFMTENQIEPMTMDPTFDKMIADAYNIVDPTEYVKALHAAEDYLVKENAYMIPLFTQIPVLLKQPYVEGTWVDTAGYIYYENAYVAG